MKQVVLSFLKKNWLKVGVLSFLLFVAFQDDLSFIIDWKTPKKTRMNRTIEQEEPKEKEILSTNEAWEEPAPKAQRFNLQPFSWRKKNKDANTSESTPTRKPKKKSPALARLAEVDPVEIDAFIKRFAHVAIGEQEKYGIPSSIIIANGLLMSTANKAVLSLEYQNFFQLPCTAWDGATTYLHGQCYREYETAWLSFRDHSNYLKQLRDNSEASLGATDYKAWAKFLGQQNFGQEKDYKKQLLQLIEDLELFYLDQSS